MLPMLALRLSLGTLFAADTTFLADATGNKLVLLKADFTPDENLDLADLTLADFDGYAAKTPTAGATSRHGSADARTTGNVSRARWRMALGGDRRHQPSADDFRLCATRPHVRRFARYHAIGATTNTRRRGQRSQPWLSAISFCPAAGFVSRSFCLPFFCHVLCAIWRESIMPLRLTLVIDYNSAPTNLSQAASHKGGWTESIWFPGTTLPLTTIQAYAQARAPTPQDNENRRLQIANVYDRGPGSQSRRIRGSKSQSDGQHAIRL